MSDLKIALKEKLLNRYALMFPLDKGSETKVKHIKQYTIRYWSYENFSSRWGWSKQISGYIIYNGKRIPAHGDTTMFRCNANEIKIDYPEMVAPYIQKQIKKLFKQTFNSWGLCE